MDITIRRGEPGDALFLTSISFGAKRHWNYSEEYLESWHEQLTITEEYINQNVVFIAQKKSTIIGYCSIVEATEANMKQLGFDKPGFWLDHIYIRPAYIQAGIGSELMEDVNNYCRDNNITTLYIESDPHAKGFFEKLGATYIEDTHVGLGEALCLYEYKVPEPKPEEEIPDIQEVPEFEEAENKDVDEKSPETTSEELNKEVDKEVEEKIEEAKALNDAQASENVEEQENSESAAQLGSIEAIQEELDSVQEQFENDKKQEKSDVISRLDEIISYQDEIPKYQEDTQESPKKESFYGQASGESFYKRNEDSVQAPAEENSIDQEISFYSRKTENKPEEENVEEGAKVWTLPTENKSYSSGYFSTAGLGDAYKETASEDVAEENEAPEEEKKSEFWTSEVEEHSSEDVSKIQGEAEEENNDQNNENDDFNFSGFEFRKLDEDAEKRRMRLEREVLEQKLRELDSEPDEEDEYVGELAGDEDDFYSRSVTAETEEDEVAEAEETEEAETAEAEETEEAETAEAEETEEAETAEAEETEETETAEAEETEKAETAESEEVEETETAEAEETEEAETAESEEVEEAETAESEETEEAETAESEETEEAETVEAEETEEAETAESEETEEAETAESEEAEEPEIVESTENQEANQVEKTQEEVAVGTVPEESEADRKLRAIASEVAEEAEALVNESAKKVKEDETITNEIVEEVQNDIQENMNKQNETDISEASTDVDKILEEYRAANQSNELYDGLTLDEDTREDLQHILDSKIQNDNKKVEVVNQVESMLEQEDDEIEVADETSTEDSSDEETKKLQMQLDQFQVKSEKEKMISGEQYIEWGDEIANDKRKARKLLKEFNNADPEDKKTINQLMQELFGSVGEYAQIEPEFRCNFGYNIHLGDNFYAGYNCVILDNCPVKIGNNCILSPQVGIYTLAYPLEVENRIAGYEYAKPVTIGDNVWIGAGSIINPGVTIGNNVVAKPGSVITEDIPDNTIVAGNPAKPIQE